jgi:hypothetical protein
VIRLVVRYINNCDECGIDGPDDWPTPEQAEQAVCPCTTGDVLNKPPSIERAFRGCDDATAN